MKSPDYASNAAKPPFLESEDEFLDYRRRLARSRNGARSPVLKYKFLYLYRFGFYIFQ